jgi:hypothetical protein
MSALERKATSHSKVVGEVNKTLSSQTKAWDSGEAPIVSESRILFYQNDNEVFSTINITSRP